MSFAAIAFDALRVAALLGAALVVGFALVRRTAATRRSVYVAALVAALAAPFAARVMTASRAARVVDWPLLSFEPAVEPVGSEALSAFAMPSDAPATVVNRAAMAVSASASRVSVVTLLFVVWTFGAAVVLMRLAYGLMGARRLGQRAHRDAVGPFEDVIAQTLRQAAARAEVAISDDVATPAVTGVFRPVVLMPRAALAWSKSRWHVVLLHELSHVRARDCLVGVVAEMVCAVHWFDPLAWLLRKQWRKIREFAADEDVVARGVRPSDYAAHLLDVAGAVGRAKVPRAALAMAGQPSELAGRLERIVRGGSIRLPSRGAVVGVYSVGCGLTLLVACAGPPSTPSPEQRVDEAPTSKQVSPPGNAPGAPKDGLVSRSIAELASKVTEVIGGPADRNELTIDPRLQAIADEEAARVVTNSHPRAVTAIILDPAAGEILALANPDLARRALITGSTMKAVTIAAALDAGLVSLDQKFDCAPRPGNAAAIHDDKPHGPLDLAEIMEVSCNVGAMCVYRALGDRRFEQALNRFHLGGEEPPVQLKEAAFSAEGPQGPFVMPGDEAEGAIGEGFVTTPLQMLAVYAVFANGGAYVAPSLVRSVRDEAGRTYWRHAPKPEPVLRPETAQAVMGMLEGAVSGSHATGKAARVQGVRVAGKTGTSALHEPNEGQVYASFIGIVPADAPRYVILVGALDPEGGGWGGTVAAPAFARIAARALSLP